ncbi:M protein trans-acting positive regulator PRD domain-containing protein [Streptococcus porcinus]|uniref:Mga-like regulatory protein n=1 Tax=Streptococcus porcinus TaxID=1340 RepID=A0A4V0H1B6_STRPO|nr:M protein trans-acting positive regulator PRD domain-containing protein [Streptococcus porcinus]VTT41502.1 Mga-like regulatory protein [Streptococcus porcinus]VTT42392.1 Mga-like regulatory protein [Streptococcus porcinus]
MITTKELFSNQQLRSFNLLKLLNQEEHCCDYKDICHHLDCSFLTLQTEIAHLSTFSEIKSLPYKGPYLTLDYQKESGPQKLYQSILLETPSLRLIEAIFFEEFDSLDELAESLFISLSTLKRLIKRTNHFLQLVYGCHIDFKSITMIGKEEDIRLLYLKYFSEAYDCGQWPFVNRVNERAVMRLIDLIAQQLDAPVSHFFFHHLKVVAGVNIIRFAKGYRINHTYTRSTRLFQKLKEDPNLQELAQLFWQDFAQPLDALALSEIFSTYFHQEIIVNTQDDVPQTPALVPEEINIISYKEWLETLESIQKRLSLPISNSKEIAKILHNATILKEHDAYQSYLVYDYKEPYIDYFQKSYPLLLEALKKALLAPFTKRGIACPEKQQQQLLYSLLVNWDNLFLHLSQAISQQKVLVIEKGTRNTGQFLKAFTGQYFDITIHDHYEIDMRAIRKKYDLVLTDISLEKSEGIDIYFFSQLVPSVALEELNHYLKEKVEKHFMTCLAETEEL